MLKAATHQHAAHRPLRVKIRTIKSPHGRAHLLGFKKPAENADIAKLAHKGRIPVRDKPKPFKFPHTLKPVRPGKGLDNHIERHHKGV